LIDRKSVGFAPLWPPYIPASAPRLRVRAVNLGVAVAQNILLQFAHGVAGEILDEDHALGQFELGEAAFERGEDRLLGKVRGLVLDHDSGHALAEIRLRPAE